MNLCIVLGMQSHFVYSNRHFNTTCQHWNSKWKILKNRKLQMYGGTPSEKGMILEKMPSWLTDLIDEMSAIVDKMGVERYNNSDSTVPTKFIKPNHALINDYEPGQGIMPHKDGPLYNPVILTLSLGSAEFEHFKHDEDKTCRKTVLNSLIVIFGDMYKRFLHHIEEGVINEQCESGLNFNEKIEIEKKRRVSLTLRYVPKVRKNPFRFK